MKKSGVGYLCLDIFSTQYSNLQAVFGNTILHFSSALLCSERWSKMFWTRKTVRSPRIRNENKTNKHKSQKLAAFYQLIERKIQQAALSLKIATTGLQFLGFVEFRGPGSWMQAGENDYRGRMDTAFNMVKKPFLIWRKAVSVCCMQPGYLTTLKPEF